MMTLLPSQDDTSAVILLRRSGWSLKASSHVYLRRREQDVPTSQWSTVVDRQPWLDARGAAGLSDSWSLWHHRPWIYPGGRRHAPQRAVPARRGANTLSRAGQASWEPGIGW